MRCGRSGGGVNGGWNGLRSSVCVCMCVCECVSVCVCVCCVCVVCC